MLKEPLSLEERLTAIYIKAVRDTTIFRFIKAPSCPLGYRESYEDYKKADKSDQPALWKGILEEFKGYIAERDRCESENNSNKHFLLEMKAHFLKVGLSMYLDRIQTLLNDFSENVFVDTSPLPDIKTMPKTLGHTAKLPEQKVFKSLIASDMKLCGGKSC